MKPDRLVVFRGADGDWRWQRRNAANGRIVAVSGEGYRRRSHTVGMAFALHEWATEVHIADGRDAGKTIRRRA